MRTRVAALAELEPGTPRLVTAGGEDLLLVRRGEEVLAIGNVCPHQGGSLADGWLEGDIVVCPLHGWEFDLRSGACMTIPGERVPAYRVSVEDGQVYVEPADG
jgi:nitrite reductase/ring-hydroxylating ferredoxin subunit